MQKPMIVLVSSGASIAVGLILLAVGAQFVLDSIMQGEGMVRPGSPLEVEAVLNAEEEPTGVFAVQVMATDHDNGIIYAMVVDPVGSEVAGAVMPLGEEQPHEFDVGMNTNSEVIVDGTNIEGKFNVGVSGRYLLVVEGSNMDGLHTFGAIGPVPDIGTTAFAFAPFYMIVAGIVGMGGLAVYWITTMRRIPRRR